MQQDLYQTLGIIPADFKGLTQAQIEKALDNIIRANTITLNSDNRSGLTSEERASLLLRLQAKNQAAEKLKDPSNR